MERSEQIAQSLKLLDYMNRRTTAMADDIHVEDTSVYASPQRAERERRMIARLPLNLGLSGRLPNPGDWLTEDYSGTPILLVRDRNRSLTIIIVEHEMGVIERITDRCVVLNFGRKIAEGPYRVVAADPQVQEAYLGAAR